MSNRRSTRRATAREYPRTARLNELLREIVADELERIDDDRLPLLTVVSVEVEPDLRRATVYYDHLDGDAGDDDALEALGEARKRLQAAIGKQAHMKWTPELSFRPDPSVRSGERIDTILRDMGDDGVEQGEADRGPVR
jgi:ribosome-binding factor A